MKLLYFEHRAHGYIMVEGSVLYMEGSLRYRRTKYLCFNLRVVMWKIYLCFNALSNIVVNGRP